LPAKLRRWLSSTNVTDSAHPGMRKRTRRGSRRQDGSMALGRVKEKQKAKMRSLVKLACNRH